MSVFAMRTARFFGLLLLAFCSLVHSAPLSLRFEHLGVEQGLTQESVTRVIQDRQGFIWIGTQAGLNRFDGYRVTVFKNDPGNPHSLLDNYVQALYEDAGGRLWVGSKGGLDRYDPSTGGFVHQAIKTGNLAVTNIIGDGKDGLWLTTSEGLQHLDIKSGQVRTLRHAPADPDSISDDRVNAVARDKSGNLWIATASEVMLFDGAAPCRGVRCWNLAAPGGSISRPLAVAIHRLPDLSRATALTRSSEMLSGSAGACRKVRTRPLLISRCCKPSLVVSHSPSLPSPMMLVTARLPVLMAWWTKPPVDGS